VAAKEGGEPEEDLQSGDSPALGLIVSADDDHLEAAAEGFGGTASAALIEHDEVDFGDGQAGLAGDLISEARTSAKIKAQAARDAEAARETRQGSTRRPWIAAAVVLVALAGGLGLVLTQGEREADTVTVARAEQNSMSAAKPAGSESARVRVPAEAAPAAMADEEGTGEKDPGTEEDPGTDEESGDGLMANGTDADSLLAAANGGTEEGETGTGDRGRGVVGAAGNSRKDRGHGKSKGKDGKDEEAGGDGEDGGPAEASGPEGEGGGEDEKAPAPEGESPAAGEAAAEGEPAAEKPKSASDQDKVDCLLNSDLEKCGGKKKEAKQETADEGPALPEKLNASQLRNGFAGIKAAAKKCGQQHGAEAGTKVKIHVSIEGATGKVKSSKAKGEFAGTPLGECVANSATGASFAQFSKAVMGTDFSLRM
jgi:hypothetical protein